MLVAVISKDKGLDTKECIVGCIGGAVKNFRRYLLTIDCFRHVSQFCCVRGFRFWQHSFLAVCLVTHSKVKPNLLFYCKHFFEKPLTEETFNWIITALTLHKKN